MRQFGDRAQRERCCMRGPHIERARQLQQDVRVRGRDGMLRVEPAEAAVCRVRLALELYTSRPWLLRAGSAESASSTVRVASSRTNQTRHAARGDANPYQRLD